MLGVPCLTLRNNTERPITITHGTNRLVGLDPSRILTAAAEALSAPASSRRPPLWDGHTAERVASILGDGTPLVEWVPPALGQAVLAGRDPVPIRD